MNKYEEAIARQVAMGRAEGSVGALLYAVRGIHTREEAVALYEGYLEHLRGLRGGAHDRHTAEEIALSNIGWCYGEDMKPEDVEMWKSACGAEHPALAPSPTQRVIRYEL